MTDAKIPIFDIKDKFDTAIEIGDKVLPIHVKRYTRTACAAFFKKWDAVVGPPRGSAEVSEADKAAREREQLAFYEETIVEAITLESGLVRDRDRDVTTGEGLLEVFHSRIDVLSALVSQVYIQNKLGGLIRKNSNSPRASVPGSAPSTPASGGDRQDLTAESVGRSDSASSERAMDESDSAEGSPSSSGATRNDEEPIVH